MDMIQQYDFFMDSQLLIKGCFLNFGSIYTENSLHNLAPEEDFVLGTHASFLVHKWKQIMNRVKTYGETFGLETRLQKLG